MTSLVIYSDQNKKIMPEDYNEIIRRPAQRPDIVPEWWPHWNVSYEWEANGYIEIEFIRPEWTEVVIEKGYAHENGKCFEITEFVVYDYIIKLRRGTVLCVLHIPPNKLRYAKYKLRNSLNFQVGEALLDAIIPDEGAIVDEIIDVALRTSVNAAWQTMSTLELLENIEKITDRFREMITELNALPENGRKIIERIENVEWEPSHRKVRKASPNTIKEIECERWILSLPEGHVRRVPERDEVLALGGEAEFTEIFERLRSSNDINDQLEEELLNQLQRND